MYMKARWMSPTTGTFLSVDPVVDLRSPHRHNPYIYAANNPISHVDRSGAIAINVAGGIWGGLAAAGGNLAGQLATNGRDFGAVNVWDVGIAGFVGAGTGFFFPLAGASSYTSASVVGATGNSAEAVIRATIDTAQGKGPKSFWEFASDVFWAGVTGAVGGTGGRYVGRKVTPRNVRDDSRWVRGGRGFAGETLEEALEGVRDGEPEDTSQDESSSQTTTGISGVSVSGAGQNGAFGGGGGFLTAPMDGAAMQPFNISPPPPSVTPIVTIICLAGPC